MTEESAAPSTSVDKTDSMDVDGEAKKLLGLGQKNLVMGDIPAAVNAFQEAASMLGKKYGETANECAEAFFFYGKSLLELARMENGVLGNALEGVQVEEEEKAEGPVAESTDNIEEEAREELREQVYNAMGEKDESRKTAEEPLVLTEAEMQLKSKDVEMEEVKEEKVNKETMDLEEKTDKKREEEEINPENQMETAEREKQGDNEIITEVAKGNFTAMKDMLAAAEEQASVTVKEKPVMAEEAEEEKPAMAEEAVKEKPAMVEEAVKEKPAMVEEAVKEKPAMVEEAVKEKSAMAEEAVKEKSAMAEEAVKEKSAMAEEAGEENPAMAEEAGEEKPAMAEEAGEEKPAMAEEAGEEKPAMAEEAGEDTTINKPMTTEKAAGAQQPVPAGETGEDASVEKIPVAAEEKPVEAVTKEEKGQEAAVKFVDQVAETQTNSIAEKLVMEKAVKTSEVKIEELATALEKAKSQVETEIEEKQQARAIDEKAKKIDTTEQVVVDLKEKEELLSSEKTLPSTASGITPAGDTEPSQEKQMEETAEAAKVEKEEEKDDEMGEGEDTEGSEDEDKENDKEEDKENYSTVEEKESEDEVGNLELAWDMLELAKVIYKRQDTKEAQLRAAQAHLKLGEVSIESENYIQAIEEFHSCLTLQQKYLEAHDRLLAETHYHLGLAYHYNNQYDEAVLQFSKSMEVIDKRMVMLTERLRAKGEGLAEDEKEIEELKGLLPDIKEKIEDSKESQKSAGVAELALKATLVGGSSSSFSQGTESSLTSTNAVGQKADGASQCITDISHLVRKKRKPEEEAQQGDHEAKKSKPEPAVNGGGDAAPSGNEVAEKMEEETEERPQIDTVQTTV